MEIEMIQCHSKLWVPIVDGILLHSSVNPEKEAVRFVDEIWPQIENVKNVIVLGLGGGFHVRELAKRGVHRIVVVEANPQLVQAVFKKNRDLKNICELVIGNDAAAALNDNGLLEALASSYSIVLHPPSVRLHPEFYQSVSDGLSQRTLRRLRELTQKNPNLHRFFNSIDFKDHQIVTLPMMEQAIKRSGSGLEREGLIWMTLRELVV